MDHLTKYSKPLSLPAVDILGIFQLENSNIYNLVANEQERENIYDCVVDMLGCCQTPTAAILANKDRTVDYTAFIAKFENACVAMTITLHHMTENGTPQAWLFFVIAERVTSTEGPAGLQTIRPLYILSGIVDKDKKLIPHDSLCLSSSTKGGLSASPLLKANEDEFFSTIMYADATFLSCILGHEIEIDKLEPCLDPEQIQMARDHYKVERRRTAEGLSRQIMIAESSVPPIQHDILIMAPPPMPQ